jgi:glycosyltransferase involved in cell wall biosynthesis
MTETSKDEPRVIVVGYSPELRGGVTQVTRVLMQNFKEMELHPCLYCYSPKYKAGILYFYSILKFICKFVFLKNKRPDIVLLIIGSTGDAVRVIPFIWLSYFLKMKLCAQYHKSGDVILAGIRRNFLQKFVMISLRKIGIHCFLSKRLKDSFEKLFPYKIESIVIPNALEKQWLAIEPLPLSNRFRDVVFFGRWSAEKGVQDLIQCMEQISGSVSCEIYSNHVPKENFRNCKVFPWVGESEVIAIMRTAKLLVLPSYAEAYPTVLLEAAACGTPFIASDLAGILDITEQSGAGTIFEMGNVNELQKKIGKILNNKTQWEGMSKKGKLWVQYLSADNIRKQWLEVLKSQNK